MSDEIMVAVITSVGSVVVSIVTLIGVIKSNNKSKKDVKFTLETGHEKLQQELKIGQEVQKKELELLTKQVEKHNNVIERTTELEAWRDSINHEIKDLKETQNKLLEFHMKG